MSARALALGVVLVLAGTACADDPSTVDGLPGQPSPTTGAPAEGSDGAPGGPATTTPRPGGTIIVGGTEAVPDPAPRPGGGSPAELRGGPGDGAGYLLRPTGAQRIVVQVITQPGAEPRRATLDRALQVLRDASGKPVDSAGGTVTETREVWSGADLRRAADAAAFDVPAGTAVVRLLFVRGRSSGGEQALGVATAADVAAVFSDRVAAAATTLVPAATIERAVTTHELGHLLGLVDLFLDTGRADPEHPGHSSNRRSVMYWAVESTLITDLLAGGPPQDFDDDDRADLAAIRRG